MSYDEHLISMAGGDGELDLAAIEARAENATPGPWKASDFGHPGQEEPSSIIIHRGAFNWRAIDEGQYVAAMPAWDSQEDADAEFIAHARTDIPALLSMVREQRAVIERVREVALSLHDPRVIQHSFHIGSDPEHDAYKAQVAARIRAALTATEPTK